MQDADGDVVAVIDDNGPPRQAPLEGGGAASIPTALVVAQCTYDAYGEVQSADYDEYHPACYVGHKGLFVDRLDAPESWQSGQITTDGTPRLIPYAHNLYHSRNRMYAPDMGRFMQADPNVAGIATLSTIAFHGNSISPAATPSTTQATEACLTPPTRRVPERFERRPLHLIVLLALPCGAVAPANIHSAPNENPRALRPGGYANSGARI